jgi:hypothetical protein
VGLKCGNKIGEATTQLIAIDATSVKDRCKLYAGEWIEAGAILVHSRCACMVSDDKLGLWARRRHRRTGKR